MTRDTWRAVEWVTETCLTSHVPDTCPQRRAGAQFYDDGVKIVCHSVSFQNDQECEFEFLLPDKLITSTQYNSWNSKKWVYIFRDYCKDASQKCAPAQLPSKSPTAAARVRMLRPPAGRWRDRHDDAARSRDRPAGARVDRWLHPPPQYNPWSTPLCPDNAHYCCGFNSIFFSIKT